MKTVLSVSQLSAPANSITKTVPSQDLILLWPAGTNPVDRLAMNQESLLLTMFSWDTTVVSTSRNSMERVAAAVTQRLLSNSMQRMMKGTRSSRLVRWSNVG